jgi:hypothetical protein
MSFVASDSERGFKLNFQQDLHIMGEYEPEGAVVTDPY